MHKRAILEEILNVCSVECILDDTAKAITHLRLLAIANGFY